MNRTEHLQWCKKRALEYAENGDYSQALSSMGSDLNKHPETEEHSGMEIGLMQVMSGGLSDYQSMSKFINGFN